MADVHPDLRRHHGEYGVDGDFRGIAPHWHAVIVAAICLGLVVATVACLAAGDLVAGTVLAVVTVVVLFTVASYLHTTRVGKFRVWARILTDLRLRGDEKVLDIGCGRGALLMAAATLLPDGRAFGVDIWRPDQTGNGPDAARRNAAREGVADRIELYTADMTRLPFADDTFDLIISSLAVHNVPAAAGRRAAIDEAVRVLRPGGRLALADLAFTSRYRAELRELPVSDVRRRNLGARMWWGGPWFPTRLLTATKNAQPR